MTEYRSFLRGIRVLQGPISLLDPRSKVSSYFSSGAWYQWQKKLLNWPLLKLTCWIHQPFVKLPDAHDTLFWLSCLSGLNCLGASQFPRSFMFFSPLQAVLAKDHSTLAFSFNSEFWEFISLSPLNNAFQLVSWGILMYPEWVTVVLSYWSFQEAL